MFIKKFIGTAGEAAGDKTPGGATSRHNVEWWELRVILPGSFREGTLKQKFLFR